MVCDKCGAAYVSENCPNCEEARTAQPQKERKGLRKLKKATMVILVLVLVVTGLAAGCSILDFRTQQASKAKKAAEEKAQMKVEQYVNDEVTARMQELYPGLTRTDILSLYSAVDKTEVKNGWKVENMSPAQAELHVSEALSHMRTYMNVAEASGVTDMSIVTAAIYEQHKVNQEKEAAEREALARAIESQSGAIEARSGADDVVAVLGGFGNLFAGYAEFVRALNEAQ